jgi:hypothetical protein
VVLQEKIDKLAELTVPNKAHPLLHVNCQTAWTNAVTDLIKKKSIKVDYKSLMSLAKNWEYVLYKTYSNLN